MTGPLEVLAMHTAKPPQTWQGMMPHSSRDELKSPQILKTLLQNDIEQVLQDIKIPSPNLGYDSTTH